MTQSIFFAQVLEFNSIYKTTYKTTKGEKQVINEKDIDELLNIRKKLSNAEWDFINSVICETLNSRVQNELTDSEIEKISKHLKCELI